MEDNERSDFAKSSEVVPVSFNFITSLSQIDDVYELKSLLYIFFLISTKNKYPQYITYSELQNNNSVIKFKSDIGILHTTLKKSLNLAVQKGFLLQMSVTIDGKHEEAYFIHTESNEETLGKIKNGDIEIADILETRHIGEKTPQIPNVFILYEQNIGILTPIIAEELKEAEKQYPFDWIESAIKEAVTYNKRNWKYIARILERWSSEGKNNGKFGRNIKREEDPNKYIRGKYGHMVKR